MKLRLVAAILAIHGLAACGDPELHVVFDVPERYRSEITSTRLRVLEPPVAEPFRCDDLAFGTVDPELVRLSQVLEIGGSAREPVPLGDIDRLAPKLMIADGLDAAGRRLVTACTELGEIEETQDVVLAAEPIAVVTASRTPDLRFNLATPASKSVLISVRDLLGNPVSGASARWKILGAAERGSEGMSSTDASGVMTILAAPPDRPGPMVLSVRVRWAESEPLRLSGAVSPEKQVLRMDGRAVDYRVGRIGPGGEPGVVALSIVGPTLRVALAIRSPNGSFQLATSEPVDPSAQLLILEDAGGGRDTLLVVTDRDWIRVAPDASFDTRGFAPIVPSAAPVSLFSAEPCTPGAAPQVLVNFDNGAIAVYDGNGARINHFLNGIEIEAVASGCVSASDGSVLRTLLLGTGSFGLLVVSPLSPLEFLIGTWIALDFGVGFSPPVGDSGRLLLGTQLNVNDIVISRMRLVKGVPDTDEELTLENLGLDTVPFTPQYTYGGELDGDGKIDVVSLLYEPGVQGDPQRPDRFHVWSILGIDDGGRRIAGPVVTDITQLRGPILLFGDFDGDRIDDVLLGDRPATGNDSLVEIYTMGAR